MERLFRITWLLIVVVALFVSCEKSNDNEVPIPADTNPMSALIEGNEWEFYVDDNVGREGYVKQVVKGDTIIDGVTYAKVYTQIDDEIDPFYNRHSQIGLSNFFNLYYRQEGGIIYWKYNLEQDERRLYNLNLCKGDRWNTVEVVGVRKIVLSDSIERRCMEVKGLKTGEHDLWIEGIGALQGGINQGGFDDVINPDGPPSFYIINSWRLLKFHSNGVELHSYDTSNLKPQK